MLNYVSFFIDDNLKYYIIMLICIYEFLSSLCEFNW